MAFTLPASLRLGSLVLASAGVALAQNPPPGEGPALGNNRITQSDITSGALTLTEVRQAGLKIFSTPFNAYDGYGDGLLNLLDKTSPGGRPSLQNNGMFLRVNGLDAQSCMECHSVGSNAVVPFRFAIGGAGGANNNAIFQPTEIDVDDDAGNGFAAFNGRFINPPFLFGSGGVEQVGKAMTRELNRIRNAAQANAGTTLPLVTHGVNFGTITYDFSLGEFDTSGYEGIDEDLVVKPFGRKGEFATVRGFDVEALAFHMGMQAVEKFGPGVDPDGDGYSDEILIGELSAMHIFNTNLERPEVRDITPASIAGQAQFSAVGCAECHVPSIDTNLRRLTYQFPEDPTSNTANAFYAADLRAGPAGFEAAANGSGIAVPMFSDLKRHDMGPGLAEAFGSALDSQFITARLWGVADTAPYMHDGRALSLTEAILDHGGEAQASRDAFDALAPQERIELLTFLRTLRTPIDPASDL